VARLNQLPKDRLESTITTIQGQLDRAEKNLATTEQAFQTFSTSSTLVQDQAELTASTDERTKLTDELAQATQALGEIKAQLKTQNENLLNAEAVIPQNNNPNNPNTNSNTNAITSMSGDLETVRSNLTAQTQTARQKYLETSNAIQAFEANNTIPVLQGRVDSIIARLNVISTKLQSSQTELNVAQSRLTDTKAQLAKQPQLLNLSREITSDPAIMATITANQSELKSLIGLKLQNQELNPAFQDLLQASIELQLTVNNINNENTAFIKEKASLEKLLPTLQNQLATLNQKKSRVTLEADIAQTVYTGLQNRLAQLSGIRNTGSKPLKLDNPNVEYQRLRSSVSDLSVLEARQNATFTALNARATQLDNRIVLLRGRVAKASVENTRLSDRLSLAQQEFKALTQKLADLKIEQASSGNLAQVLVPAFAPTRKSNSALFIVAIMGVVGLLIGLMIPFLIEGVKEPTPIELNTPELTRT
jgi:predicted  nucleic acid-binding Zn-ribbon protein